MPIASPPLTEGILKAHVTSLRLLFAAWITHFKSLGYIKDSTLETLDKTVCKKTLELTVKDEKIREALGTSKYVWSDLVEVFRAAVPSFELRSYASPLATSPEYDEPSSTVIVAHSTTLLKDLQRLDHMLAIARNVLTVGEKAQNVAAQSGFDREVCQLINLCIKITARGYDGDSSGGADEDKWQLVINGFKKLLITSLQFLSNLVTMNERLKLMLWVELFDTSSENAANQGTASESPSEAVNAGSWVMNATKAFMRSPDSTIQLSTKFLNEQLSDNSERPVAALPAYFAWLKENREQIKADLSVDGPVDNKTIAREASLRWSALSESSRAPWKEQHEDTLNKIHKDLESFKARYGTFDPQTIPKTATEYLALLSMDENSQSGELDDARLSKESDVAQHALIDRPEARAAVEEADFQMLETADDGAKKLQEGKDQLLKRLESYPSERTVDVTAAASPNSPVLSPRSPINTEGDFNSDGADVGDSIEDEDSSDEDDDFAGPGEDGRGLLTDIPLILGPNEIEVLPMIIMSGIVAPAADPKKASKDNPEEHDAIINMHTIRCHLLLAQENGRNLLRELLIFVAAWDLREEELYFKFMVKIMESILTNGLMPFAYGAFKESKDIISPAQAVIMKLLTKIFHSRQGSAAPRSAVPPLSFDAAAPSTPAYPLRYDVQIVHCLFNEFRTSIIPQICALIFLQGQIRAGKASPDDFPLNLWDMERMYEGVYQYLEFFAILTDHDVWKQMMAEWEVTSELVTLLRELEQAIPKGRLAGQKSAENGAVDGNTKASPANNSGHSSAGNASSGTPEPALPKPVAVERPFDLDPNVTAQDQVVDEDLAAKITEITNPYPNGPQDEPAEFEWRNLKKLCVLVLSSLVWKNRKLQDQVRNFDGVMTILSCCAYDEHNPYIREHAIMCLRFLMEGNKENQAIIRSLDAQEVVPSEVLDHHGYETFMDNKGQVGLRRKEAVSTPLNRLPTPSPSSAGGSVDESPSVDTSMPDWMQMVMKAMPNHSK